MCGGAKKGHTRLNIFVEHEEPVENKLRLRWFGCIENVLFSLVIFSHQLA